MTSDADLKRRIEEVAAKHNIEIKSARRFGDSLFIEANHEVNELAYFAAILFYKLSDYEFEKVAVRHSVTGQTEEFDMYEVLERLILAADLNDDIS